MEEAHGLPARQGSRPSETSTSIEDKVHGFEAERKAQRLLRIHRVSRVGVLACCIGVTLSAVSFTVLAGGIGELIGEPLGYFLVSTGLGILTACPVHDLNTNLVRSPKINMAMWAALTAYSLLNVVFEELFFRIVWLPRLLLSLWGGVVAFCHAARSPCRLGCPSQTTLLALFAFSNLGVIIPAPVPVLRLMDCQRELMHYICACVHGVLTCGSLGCFLRRWYQHYCLGLEKASPTLALYYVWYAFLFLMGSHWFISGILIVMAPPLCLQNEVASRANLLTTLCGLGFLLPICAVVCLGRGRVFGLLSRRLQRSFERSRAVKDGAFMAALLDSVAVEVGGPWWVHHGSDNQQFAKHDPRRNWDQATIVEITETELVVELLGASGNQDLRRRLPKSQSSSSSEQLMQRARSELRCIDWQEIVRHKDELFFGGESAVQTGELHSLSGGNLFNCSRPLKEHERIDFFVSHSWHDDSRRKWAALQAFTQAFHEEHHRYPTFWLDNVCIDQSRIQENLKVLPINLMSCEKMLVITGPTYPYRLWCVWELLTLFAFTDEVQAVERVEVLMLEEENNSSFNVLLCLQSFDVKDAHCYDPNEEAKLRAVIEAVGADRFNDCIRALGVAIAVRQARAAERTSASTSLASVSSSISLFIKQARSDSRTDATADCV